MSFTEHLVEMIFIKLNNFTKTQTAKLAVCVFAFIALFFCVFLGR